jgi:2-dehydro-3-deoxygalactonokinase
MTRMTRMATFIAVDAGTTRTRAWLVRGERIAARRDAVVGARDTARRGDEGPLRAALRESIAVLLDGAGRDAPAHIVAAGMITSAEGLVEVPHLIAPAGVADLAAAVQEKRFPDISDLPFVLIPGVRTTAIPGISSGIGATDVMRGEETLGMGLLRQGRLVPGGALVNVGSHWKLVRIDDRGRIAWSVTSLAGEMMHAARRDTILASALPEGPLATLDVPRFLEGMAESRRSGLARALFCVRLLQLGGAAPAEGRLSFLAGAFVAADLDTMLANGWLPAGTPVTVVGDEKLAGAWGSALGALGLAVESLAEVEAEAAFVAGACAVMDARAARAGAAAG